MVAADIDDRHCSAAKLPAEFHNIFADFFFKHKTRHRVAEQNHAVIIARVRDGFISFFESCVPVGHAQPRLIFAARRGKRIAFGLHFFAEPAAVAISFQNAHRADAVAVAVKFRFRHADGMNCAVAFDSSGGFVIQFDGFAVIGVFHIARAGFVGGKYDGIIVAARINHHRGRRDFIRRKRHECKEGREHHARCHEHRQRFFDADFSDIRVNRQEEHNHDRRGKIRETLSCHAENDRRGFDPGGNQIDKHANQEADRSEQREHAQRREAFFLIKQSVFAPHFVNAQFIKHKQNHSDKKHQRQKEHRKPFENGCVNKDVICAAGIKQKCRHSGNKREQTKQVCVGNHFHKRTTLHKNPSFPFIWFYSIICVWVWQGADKKRREHR